MVTTAFHRSVATPSVMDNFLKPYYEENNPFLRASEVSRTIEPVSFLKQGHSYFLEWDEETRDIRTKALKSTERWKAVVTIHHDTNRTIENLKSEILNPFGLYITDLSWSKTSS
jgi:type IV secretion system protein VirB5